VVPAYRGSGAYDTSITGTVDILQAAAAYVDKPAPAKATRGIDGLGTDAASTASFQALGTKAKQFVHKFPIGLSFRGL
jgi:hypothetical protein